jgi:hypothetical protein
MTRIVLTGSTLSVDTVFPSLARKVEVASKNAQSLERVERPVDRAAALLPLLNTYLWPLRRRTRDNARREQREFSLQRTSHGDSGVF